MKKLIAGSVYANTYWRFCSNLRPNKQEVLHLIWWVISSEQDNIYKLWQLTRFIKALRHIRKRGELSQILLFGKGTKMENLDGGQGTAKEIQDRRRGASGVWWTNFYIKHAPWTSLRGRESINFMSNQKANVIRTPGRVYFIQTKR